MPTVDVGTATSKETGVSLTQGQLYFNCVQALDGAGNPSAWVASDGFTVDGDPPPPPSAPTLNPGIHRMEVSWPAATDSVSGIATYDVAYCTPAPCTLPDTPQRAGVQVLNAAFEDLPCPAPYAFAVRATDRAGNASA